jgi:predicted RNA methylase
VVQFPPFGADRLFFEKALEMARKVYSIHRDMPGVRGELRKICKRFSARIVRTKKFRYHIVWRDREKIGHEILLVIAKK